ncbi:beta-lactamase family protein [Nocardioides panacis]|uniref:Beta-lactamase family protein n=1 Tax=Nocardioides panacis TaxID=2849501 RepID=A0A975SVW0_9ACTN|nr:serine hydrolase domain-containing protein [Nocardioides panacis]QWZ06781.1 beta-lactamase family protein [Nocardioides panacis]
MPQPLRRRSWVLGLVTVALTCVAGCLPAGPQRASPQPGVSGSPGAGRSATTAAVRRMLSAVVATHVAPGVVVVLRRGGHVQVLTAGAADVGTGAAMTSDRRFHVASLTKPVVAAAVMRLVQRGDLFLDDTVAEWLPGLLPAGDRITVADLLSHTSGLAEYNRVPAAWPVLKRHPVDQQALVAAAGRAPPTFQPGQGQSYSNTNYAVLGMVVERVTGRPLARVLDREVFGPLGMRSASLRRARIDEPPVAHGYAYGADTTGWDLTWGWAAAGLVSDAPDVDRFFHALFTGRLLAPRLVDEMARPRAGWLGQWSGYGLGLARLPTRCGPAVGHTGDVSGYVSAAYTRRDADVSVVLVATTDRDLRAGLLHDVLETALCGV